MNMARILRIEYLKGIHFINLQSRPLGPLSATTIVI